MGERHALAGRRVGGRFTLEQTLGHGGQGIVFAATQEPFGRDVVVKVLRRDTALDPDALLRFESEAHLAAGLHHPHVVAIYDFGHEEDGLAWMAMERLFGRNLADVLRDGPLPPAKALEILRQLALALAAAHAQSIVHRDIKPANLFLLNDPTARPIIKVLDFGLARFDDDDQLSKSGVRGTEAYLSPEQLDGHRATTLSDCFSAGVVFYELLTGHNPFRAPTSTETQNRILQLQPPPTGISPAIDRLLHGLLRKDPQQRLSAAELIEAIDAVAVTPGDARPVDATRRVEPAAPPSRAPWIAATAVALVVVVVALWRAPAAAPTAPLPNKTLASASASALLAPLAPKPAFDDLPLVDRKRIELGRKLFHDPRLARQDDGHGGTARRIACSTCHPLDGGGTTHDGLTALGWSGEHASWSTPTVFNAAVVYRQAWRGDVRGIETIVERPLTRPALMGKQDLRDIPQRLGDLRSDFAAAELDVDEVGLRAGLAAYVRFVEPTGSRFDRALSGGPPLDDDAERGRQAFINLGCIGCHQGEGIGGNMVQRFGVMVDDAGVYAERGVCSGDRGLYCRSDAACGGVGPCTEIGKSPVRLTGDHTEDRPEFRVPSLRNVAITAPYFHDGSAASLEDAIAVMARLQLGRTLDPHTVDDLAAFLRSLTGELPPGEIERAREARDSHSADERRAP